MAYDLPRPPVEFDFRDGRRSVPEYLVPAFRKVETYRYTYAEALDLVNAGMLSGYLNGKQDSILAAHFRRTR